MILAIKALYSQRWTVIRNLNLEDVIVKENTNETKITINVAIVKSLTLNKTFKTLNT